MPTLSLIDIAEPLWPETEQSIETVSHEVTDRREAYRILKADLAATSDPAWANSIKIRFDVDGENDITMPNGEGHSFRVLYEE